MYCEISNLTGWQWEYLLEKSVNWIYERFEREVKRRGQMTDIGASLAPSKDKYATNTWEERVGPNRVRRHSRINMDDIITGKASIAGLR